MQANVVFQSEEIQIEAAIRARRIRQARRLIDELLSSRERSLEARIIASRHFHRIGDHYSAVQILGSERSLAESGDGILTVLAKLHLARALTLLGSSHYALRIVEGLQDRLKPGGPGDFAARIYISNSLFAKAVPLLGPPGSVAGLNLAGRMRLLNVAEAWFGSGMRAEAISLLGELIAHTRERRPRAVLNRVLGSFFVLEARLFEAETALEAAESLYGCEDPAADRGILDQWQGALLIGNERFGQARERLARAWKLLYRPGLKPEPWLETLYFQGLFKFHEQGKFPDEWHRILLYPSSTPGRLRSWIEEVAQLPARVILDTARARLRPTERCLEPGSGRLTATERLAALLVVAGSPGLPLLRACETLWPDEPFSLEPTIRRMDRLARRCRSEEGWPVRQASLHLRMGRCSTLTCQLSPYRCSDAAWPGPDGDR